MAELDLSINTNDIPEREEFGHVPPGDYVCVFTNLGTSSKEGEDLVRFLESEIQEGEHAGRKFFDRLNFAAPEEWQIQKCYQTIAELARAVGVTQTDKELKKLMGKKFIARVVVTPSKTDPNKIFNNVKKYLPYTNGATSSNGAVSAPKPSAKAEAQVEQKDQSAVPPWKRQKA